MPWKESSVMDERLRFVARLLEGEPMTEVCREFGISRKTGYKLFERYKQDGPVALADRSRRPVRYANQLLGQIESLIVTAKKEKPHWGARKIRELLVRRLAGDVRIPATSTVHAVLDRHGLVRRMGRVRRKAEGTPLSAGTAPNELWCADFKGEFKLGDGRWCYPLKAFAAGFNTERPHDALDMHSPADVYTPAPRCYDGLPDVSYPLHDRDLLVTACGRICMHRKKINLSTVLAGQRVGLKEVDDAIWLVSFMTYDLGYIDLEGRTLQPLDNPFGTRLLPMS